MVDRQNGRHGNARVDVINCNYQNLDTIPVGHVTHGNERVKKTSPLSNDRGALLRAVKKKEIKTQKRKSRRAPERS